MVDCHKIFSWLLHGNVFTKQVQLRLQQLLPALSGAFLNSCKQILIPKSIMTKQDVYLQKHLYEKVVVLKADQPWLLDIRHGEVWSIQNLQLN